MYIFCTNHTPDDLSKQQGITAIRLDYKQKQKKSTTHAIFFKRGLNFSLKCVSGPTQNI